MLSKKIKVYRKSVTIIRNRFLIETLIIFRNCARGNFARNLYFKFLKHQVYRCHLFDPEWYLEKNPDVAGSKIDPLIHYVKYGDKEGRSPMPLFCPKFYKSRAKGSGKSLNSLLHYYLIGRFNNESPSTWFDTKYYLSKNKDVARSGIDPLYHYLHFGGVEGRSPNPQFDGTWYLVNNPEVSSARVNPLLHYLKNGHPAGLPTRANTSFNLKKPKIPQWEDISKNLSAIKNEKEPIIDIIIPVYKDKDLTLRCIASVLNANYTYPVEVIVINDFSPEPELTLELEMLADRGLITLLSNEENLGFVKTVNRGMSLHSQRDVVLLNSDTEVYNDWLDRMYSVASSTKNCASLTPLSNNATICSYPRFLHDNPYPLETCYSDLDKMAANNNRGIVAKAPSGVGFCMYIRRVAIDFLGVFDEKAFGKGYGEENDFCQRAILAGWDNLITAEVFVRHLGGASFLGEKGKRIAHALGVLNKRYPTYQRQVDEFIKDDPLWDARNNLDIARLVSFSREKNILMVCHNRGGGAERHLQEDAIKAMVEGNGVFFLRPERNNPRRVRIQHPHCRQLLNIGSFELKDTEKISALLKKLKITTINPHGMVDFEAEAPLHLKDIASRIDARMEVDIHDYKVICPRINLADENGFYCGEPTQEVCNRCLESRGNDFKIYDIEKWRKDHHQVLKFAEKVWVPDDDVKDRLQCYFPDLAYEVLPHDQDELPTEDRVSVPNNSSIINVVVIGAISKLKGFNILLECARYVLKNRLPIKYTVLGYSLNDKLLRDAGVEITGQYHENEALQMLKDLNPSIIWLPSVWPETYSYTLSIAMKMDCPICAFDLGAIARRLKAAKRSDHILPLSFACNPEQLNNFFSRLER